MKKIIEGNEKILIIQFQPVGDILLTTPIIEYLKTKFPDIKLSYMVYEHFYPMLQYNPFIDKIFQIKKVSKKGLYNFLRYIWYRIKIIKKVRKENYDIILDYIGLPSSAIISYFSGAKYRVGYGHHTGRGRLYNKRVYRSVVPKYTVIKRYDILVSLGIGKNGDGFDNFIRTVPILPKLYLSEKERQFAKDFFKIYNLNNKFTVLFSPDSPKEYKRWSIENYRELGKKLIKKYSAKILILYGPGEKEYCEELQQGIGFEAILLPSTGLLEAAAIIERVKLAVLNCGGIKHISIAVKTPSITIFGRTSSVNWHPPHLEWADFLQGDYIKDNSGFRIYPEDVLRKIDNFITKGLIRIQS